MYPEVPKKRKRKEGARNEIENLLLPFGSENCSKKKREGELVVEERGENNERVFCFKKSLLFERREQKKEALEDFVCKSF